jgi:hypothetical protein
VAATGGEEDTMSKWAMDAWLVQLFGVVLAGAAVIAAILFLVQRWRRKDRSDNVVNPLLETGQESRERSTSALVLQSANCA